jgi:hypothetical protein
MIKDLIKVANRLDCLGLTKEADVLDDLIVRISRDLGSESEYKQYMLEHPAPKGYNNSFDWPWETWVKLPEEDREDWYSLLEKLGWIPVLGLGPLSSKFVLKCFEEKWSEAAIALCFIILNFCFVLRYAGHISLLKRTVAETAFRSVVSDVIINGFNEVADRVNEALSEVPSFRELASEFNVKKTLARQYVEAEIDRYLA